jgi:hypothetical protein
MPRIKWRKHLEGEHKSKNPNAEYKICSDMRKRAKSAMEDLLLICEKASERDKILIFKNPKTRKTLIIPLIIALENTSQRMDEKLEEIMDFGWSLQSSQIEFDILALMRSPKYRKCKLIEWYCKNGFTRKQAIDRIETQESRNKYPFLIEPVKTD